MADPARRAQGRDRGRQQRRRNAGGVRAGLTAGGLGVVLLLGAGCSSSPDQDATPDRPETSESVHHHEYPDPQVTLSWNAEQQRKVEDLAVEAMTRFARPTLSYEKWWDELSPLMSAQARKDYAYTDPANVPASKVTGKPTLAPLDSLYVRIVQVPTDAGLYSITLSRSELEPDWVVERIAPPENNQAAM